MRRIIFIITYVLSVSILAQVTNEGKPISWELELTERINYINLPIIDIDKLINEDRVNDTKQGIPYRVGIPIEANYSIYDSGKWTTLDNGDRVWRIAFNSPGAVQISVNFDQYYMPEGAKLYLYNEEKSDLLGAYTAIQNQESGILGTWFVKGDALWIEYYEPKGVANKGKLSIESIIHCYRTIDKHQSAQEQEKQINSGDCNHDVNCPIGADWETHRDVNKRSVAFLNMNNGYICSGGLVNNTSNDGKPYFLTANHCYGTSNPANWAMRFKWISPGPVCASTGSSSPGPTHMVMSGATLRAKNAATDFCLVEINSYPPTNWDLTLAGWNKSDDFPDFVVGIHHPVGDIMKICRDDTGVIKASNGSPTAQTWEITTAGGGWEIGVTEGGSSGSPLYDQDGRVVGQLYGGAAACSGTNDNGQYDYYGRFGVSWDGASSSTRLKDWLDPINSNVDVLNSYSSSALNTDAAIALTVQTIECKQDYISPIITLTNLGIDPLISVDINWSINSLSEQINWSGNLNQFQMETIELDAISLETGQHEMLIEINNPNGTLDENINNNSDSENILIGGYVTKQIQLHLFTDNWCEETSWEFRNESGSIIYSGGPYEKDSEDNKHLYSSFNVPVGQCFTFEIFDSEGDGICCNDGNGFYELLIDDKSVIASGADFTYSEETEVAINNGNIENLDDFHIYPNPATEKVFVLNYTEIRNHSYQLFNILGKYLKSGNLQDEINSIPVNYLSKGVYLLQIEDKVSQEFVIKKIIVK